MRKAINNKANKILEGGKCWINIIQGRGLELPRAWGLIFNNRNREGLTEKVASELRLEEGEAMSL